MNAGAFSTKWCERCGKKRNRLLDFERWDQLCRYCRPEADAEREAIDSLDQRDKRILSLRNDEHLSAERIAARMAHATTLSIARKLGSFREKGIEVAPDPPTQPSGKRARHHTRAAVTHRRPRAVTL